MDFNNNNSSSSSNNNNGGQQQQIIAGADGASAAPNVAAAAGDTVAGWMHRLLQGGGDGLGLADLEVTPKEEEEAEREILNRKLQCQAHREFVEREIARENATSQGPYHPPPELTLTEQQLDWAWNIVDHINQNGLSTDHDADEDGHWPIQRVTDFEIAQFAVVVKEDTERAIRQMETLRRTKMEYWITDTVEQGMEAIEETIRLLPGVLLGVDVSSSEEDHDHHNRHSVNNNNKSCSSFMVAFDHSNYFPAIIRASPQNMRTYVLFHYYLGKIGCPNFEVLRGGRRMLIETNKTFPVAILIQQWNKKFFWLFWRTNQSETAKFDSTTPIRC